MSWVFCSPRWQPWREPPARWSGSCCSSRCSSHRSPSGATSASPGASWFDALRTRQLSDEAASGTSNEGRTTMAMTMTPDAPATRPAAGSPAIVARGLTKRFGGVTAVRDLNFEVRPGRVTGFLGPNGAGKTTTLRMLLGLVHPTDGEATVLGMPYRSLDRPTWAVGAVLETHAFHPQRSGRNHLRVQAAASGIPVRRVDEVLDQVGLAGAAAVKVGKYSLGMRQRLGLAGALLGDPSVLILDEPANGLDPQGIRWLRELLRAFAARGNAVLISSHLLAEMAQMADDVIVIHRGRLIRQRVGPRAHERRRRAAGGLAGA